MKKFVSVMMSLVVLFGFCFLAVSCGQKTVEVEKIVEKEVKVEVEKVYIVNITGGTAAYDETSKKITATANAPEAGTSFTKWVDASGATVSTSATYEFDAADATLIAVYEDNDLSMGIINFATAEAGFANWDGGDWMTPVGEVQSEVTSDSLNAYKFSFTLTDKDGKSLAPDWSGSSWAAWDGKQMWVRQKIALDSSANLTSGKISFDIKYENINKFVAIQLFSGDTYINAEHYIGVDGKNLNGNAEDFGETVTYLGNGWYHYEVDIATYLGEANLSTYEDAITEVDQIRLVLTTQNYVDSLVAGEPCVVYIDNMELTESAK